MPVRSATADGVLTLTIDRPHRRNAVDLTALRVLRDALRVAADDVAVRCVVLTGAGDAFCSGADLSGDSQTEAISNGAEVLATANDVVRALAALPAPVVAVVRGPAAGLGMSLALACDLVVCASDAYLLSAFVNVGLAPDGGASFLLPAAMGRAAAARVALLGERLPAPEALAAGLVSHVVPPEALQAEADRVVARLAAGPPRALMHTKQALRAGEALEAALQHEEAVQLTLLGGPENAEGVLAFLERRPAAFPPRA
ncbi:MAG: enoyl-CoA hydratase [Frankiales bacterium]|nr:enoyl-CoA hydratase [Frankiales bacterium]